jgi:hypothetical protein
MMHHCIAEQHVRREVVMTKKKPERRISIRSIRKNPPDMSKLGRALIALAMAETEAKAQAQATEGDKPENTPRPDSEDAS